MLDDGIYFEDRELVLRWGTPIEDLQHLGEPEVLDRGTSVHLTWPNCQVLGGMPVNTRATRIREEPNPRAFRIYLAELHWIRFELLEIYHAPPDVHRQLRGVHDQLAFALGAATFSYPDYSSNLPAIFWERERLLVSLGPIYGSTTLAISISHTPDGYADLQAQAARIRKIEGEGARVNYVAWYEPYDD